MSRENPFILYIGEDGSPLSQAAESRGWYVLLPQDELEALAMYSVYFPDIILLDSRMDFASDVRFHLTSAGTDRLFWVEEVRQAGAAPETLLDTIAALLGEPIPA